MAGLVGELTSYLSRHVAEFDAKSLATTLRAIAKAEVKVDPNMLRHVAFHIEVCSLILI